LEATLAQSRLPERLLVVDNGDPGPTARVLESLSPSRVEIAHQPLGDNLGPAGAASFALRTLTEAGFDWIAWCDDDTPPKTSDVWARLLALAQSPPPGAPVGGVGAVGARFDWHRGELARLADSELSGPVEVDSIGSGHQLITSAQAIARAGLPDARLFFGFYDPEYCLRLRRAGFRLLIDGDLMRTYRELAGRLDLEIRRAHIPATPPSAFWRRYYVTRNYIFMMRRTFGRPDLARREAVKALARALSAWLRGPRYGLGFARHQLRGVVDGYLSRMGRTLTPVAKYGAGSA
jgi:GT2 family glycosyltransferase